MKPLLISRRLRFPDYHCRVPVLSPGSLPLRVQRRHTPQSRPPRAAGCSPSRCLCSGPLCAAWPSGACGAAPLRCGASVGARQGGRAAPARPARQPIVWCGRAQCTAPGAAALRVVAPRGRVGGAPPLPTTPYEAFAAAAAPAPRVRPAAHPAVTQQPGAHSRAARCHPAGPAAGTGRLLKVGTAPTEAALVPLRCPFPGRWWRLRPLRPRRRPWPPVRDLHRAQQGPGARRAPRSLARVQPLRAPCSLARVQPLRAARSSAWRRRGAARAHPSPPRPRACVLFVVSD